MVRNIFEETCSLTKMGAHLNIANYVAQYKTKHNFYIFFEYCNCGDLETLINNGLQLGEPEVQYLARELLQALKVMDEARIIH